MSNDNMKQKILNGMIWSFMERFLAQIITFVVSIVLARILEPKDYGTIALVTVFITISDVFLVNGISASLIQKKNSDQLDFSSIFWVNMALSALLYVVIFVAAPCVSKFYDMDVLCPVLRVLGVSVLVSGVNSVQRTYVSKNMLFKRFFLATLVGTIASAILGIFLAIKGLGVWALVFQTLSNKSINMVTLWITVKWRPKFEFSRERVKGLFSYGWKIMVSNLLYTICNELRNLVIGKKYSSEDLAFFSKGKHYPELIVSNVQSTISAVLFPAISRVQDDIVQVKNMARKSMKMSLFLMAPLILGMVVVADELVVLILTEKWLPCVPYLRLSCSYLVLQPLMTTNLEVIKSLGKSDIYMKLEIIKRSINIILLLLVMDKGVMAIAWSTVISGFIAVALNTYPNRKLINYSYRQQFFDLMPIIFNTLLMCVCVFLVKCLPLESVVLKLLIEILVGVVSYLIISVVTQNESFELMLDVIKERMYGKKVNAPQ